VTIYNVTHLAQNKVKTCLTTTTTTSTTMLHCIDTSVQSQSEKSLSLSSQLNQTDGTKLTLLITSNKTKT